MPIACSITGFTEGQYLENSCPTFLRNNDIKAACEIWAKHWPQLILDNDLYEIEQAIDKRVMQERWIRGSSEPKKVYFDQKNRLFIKTEKDHEIISFYQQIKSCSDIGIFPQVHSITNDLVSLQDWRGGQLEPAYYLYSKINLYPYSDSNDLSFHTACLVRVKHSALHNAPYDF